MPVSITINATLTINYIQHSGTRFSFSIMLSIANMSCILNVVILSIVMMTVTIKHTMLKGHPNLSKA
jgi:hypothetical protein